MLMSAQRDHTDLLIRIHPWDDARTCYPVEARMNAAVHFAGGEMHLERSALQAIENDVTAYGSALFQTLFTGPIRRAYDRAVGLAEARTDGRLRVRLWIDPQATELHALAWECLHVPKQNTFIPLAAAAQTPFSRYMGLQSVPPAPISTRPIRMLVAVANPDDLTNLGMTPIDVDHEINALTSALSSLQRTGQLHVTLLPGRTRLTPHFSTYLKQNGYLLHDGPTTLDTLIRELATAPGYHILHFLGHGAFSRGRGTTTLFLEDADGFTDTRRDTEIVTQLAALNTLPHLIFLAACDSAKRDPQNANPYVGLAPQLVEAGIPAIIAMQDVIAPLIARELSRDFYRELLVHGSVDRALNYARLLLLENDPRSWAIPALYMRLENGQLFTADPVRSALRALLQADILNPLPAGGAYLPHEVLHFSGGIFKPSTHSVDFDTLAQENMPGHGLIETVLDIFAPLKAEQGPHGPSTIALIGDAGMGKSTELRHIAQLTAAHALQANTPRIVVPVYVNLQNIPQGARIDETMLEALIVQALDPFWEADAEQKPRDLLKGYTGPILRILFDRSEVLPYHSRRRFCAVLHDFIRRHARHEYIVAFTTDNFDIAPLTIHDTLIMLPLSERNIQRYLTQTLDHPAAKRLYDALDESHLFDLARIPWLLFKMLKQAQEGTVPRSHAQVLQYLVEDAIMDIAIDQGMRTRAAKTLYALAWRMQTTFRTTLPIDEAFEIMAAVRGNRGYSLERLYQELTTYGLLTPVGAESLRFARANIRAYCCAQALLARPDFEEALSNIAATLGRHTRYYWWSETLLLLSALMDEPLKLIHEIVYGVALAEGEQVFLAADCIRECAILKPPVFPDQAKYQDEPLISFIVSTLLWRMDMAREPHVERRVRIIQALAHLEHVEAIPRLVEIAYRPVNTLAVGAPVYEDSDVRLAAVMALRRMLAPPYEDVEILAPELAKVLNDWEDNHVTELLPYLVGREPLDAGIRAVAAFALGDLKTDAATGVLIRAFLSPNFNQETRSSAATALTLLDPAIVTQEVIVPFLSPEDGKKRLKPTTRENPELWYAHLAYLIGKIRPQDGRARAFLYRCLNEVPDITLKGIAMQAIGEWYDTSATRRFTDIALGDFSTLDLRAYPVADERHYLQHKALDALFYIGDAETLRRLQKRQNWSASSSSWSLKLENAFYRTIERIRSRQNQQ